MKKNHRLLWMLLAVVMMITLATQAFASGILPRADLVFGRATINLYEDKEVTFSAQTAGKKGSISVTACSLEEKDGNRWSRVATLTPPDHVAKDTFIYDSECDYSADISGGGPYRIKATFDADGYKIIRYSNEKSF